MTNLDVKMDYYAENSITVLFVIYHGSETFNIKDIKSRLRYLSILLFLVLIVCPLVFLCEGCLYLAVINTAYHIVLTPSEPLLLSWIILKCVDKKNSHLNFCFAHISAAKYRIFKILVSTPHN